MDARRLHRLSPDAVAIAGATGVLVAFSVALACCGSCSAGSNKDCFPPSSSRFCCAQSNLLPLSLFSRPRSSAPPLTHYSSYIFSPSFLLLPDFYLDLLVLVFILVRVTVDLLACVAFLTEVNLCSLCLLIFVMILVCFSSSPDAFSIEAASFSLDPCRSLSFIVLQAFPRI
jgi:hypothetical protein